MAVFIFRENLRMLWGIRFMMINVNARKRKIVLK